MDFVVREFSAIQKINNMYKTMKLLILGIVFSIFSICTSNTESVNEATRNAEISNPLPSWNEGATKSAIINYVVDVTNS